MAIRITPKPQISVIDEASDITPRKFEYAASRTASMIPAEQVKDRPSGFDKTSYQREYMRKRRAGEAKTVRVSIETDIVDAFKATGPGWQARLNDALRAVKP